MAEKQNLFRYRTESNGSVKAIEPDLYALQEALLAPKYNFGAPKISAMQVSVDGTLELEHDHKIDGRGLDSERSRKVLQDRHRVWRRPVVMHTIDEEGEPMEVTVPASS